MADNHAVEMCDPPLNGDDRLEMWLCLYYDKWQSFPILQLNEAASVAMDGLSNNLTKITNDEVHNA